MRQGEIIIVTKRFTVAEFWISRKSFNSSTLSLSLSLTVAERGPTLSEALAFASTELNSELAACISLDTWVIFFWTPGSCKCLWCLHLPIVYWFEKNACVVLMKKKYYLTGADRNVSWFWYAVIIRCKNGNFLLLAKKKAWTRWIFVELLMILDDIWRRGKYEK